MRRVLSIVALASLICIIGNASAQAPPSKDGIIRGIVRDESEALFPGVQLTLRNLEKPDVRKVVTDKRGQYSIETSAGIYELKAELQHFKTSTAGPIRLNENETVRIIFTMVFDAPGRQPLPPIRP